MAKLAVGKLGRLRIATALQINICDTKMQF